MRPILAQPTMLQYGSPIPNYVFSTTCSDKLITPVRTDFRGVGGGSQKHDT